MDNTVYLALQEKGDAGLCAVMPLLFTTAIVTGINISGYEDRWCYPRTTAALAALVAWDGKDGTEPKGWHRHPQSGRRRDASGVKTVCP